MNKCDKPILNRHFLYHRKCNPRTWESRVGVSGIGIEVKRAELELRLFQSGSKATFYKMTSIPDMTSLPEIT